MFVRDLTELVNSRQAWLFVGSGISIPSGYPSWGELARKTLKHLPKDVAAAIRDSRRYREAMEAGDYPSAFGAIETIATRQLLDGAVRQEFRPRPTNPLVALLADWPFAGYITTNYDDLLERALAETDTEPWVTVGNSDREIQKIGGAPPKTVWHFHGAANQDPSRSHLVLTKADYSRFYADNSLLLSQLRSVLAQRRLIFVGFGFNDRELSYVLRHVARQTTPTRPIYAILPSSLTEPKRHELERDFNVHVVSYPSSAPDDHSHLVDLLNVHDSFVLRRTQRFGDPERPCPSFDDEATGLLIFNELSLGDRTTVDEDVLKVLLKSRVLALLSAKDSSLQDISQDLLGRAQMVGGPGARPNEELIRSAVDELVESGLIEIQTEGYVRLLPAGNDLVKGERATAEREGDAFSGSLYNRANRFGSASRPALTDVQVRRIANAAESFLRESVSKRALGVAQALESGEHSDFSVVGLMQSMPSFAGQLQNVEEALPLVRIIEDVLLTPTVTERRYLGFALQAEFAVHMLGFNEAAVRARIRDLSETLFVLDAHLLIRFLAKGHPEHEAAKAIIEKLGGIAAILTTNDGFVREVASHATKAIEHLGVGRDERTAYQAASGLLGSNVFQEGYVATLASGGQALGFGRYIEDVFGVPPKKARVSIPAVRDVLRAKGIEVLGLRDWDGYKESDNTESERLAKKIQELRENLGTFRGDLQVRAEAEALLTVLRIREGAYKLKGRSFSYSSFVSPTTTVDRITSQRRVTIGIEPLLHILATLTAWSIDELSVLSNTLFAEVNRGTVLVLSQKQLRQVFNPYINLSKDHRQEFLAQNRTLIQEYWGEEEADRIASADADIPLLMERLDAQTIIRLRERVGGLERKLDQAAALNKLTREERQLFEKWRTERLAKRRRIRAKHKSGPQSARKRSKPRTPQKKK